MKDNTAGFNKAHWDQHPLTIDGLIYAFCNEDGLIGFGSDVPTGQNLIIAGYEGDMAIVRCVAHRDGNSYWVPGFHGNTHWRARLNRFIEECFAGSNRCADYSHATRTTRHKRHKSGLQRKPSDLADCIIRYTPPPGCR